MKAIQDNDKLFSSTRLSSDGVLRESIDFDLARTAFDFEIHKHKSYTQDGRAIDKHWHLRRTDDDSILPTRCIGDEFQPLQHRELFDFVVDEILPKCPDIKLETVGTMHGGATGVIMARVGDTFNITGDKSPQETRLFFFNPNGKSSLVIGTTTVRLFCQNQIQHAVREAGASGFRVQHTTNAQFRCEHALEEIANQIDTIKYLKAREERLAQVGVDSSDLHNVLDRILPLNAYEQGSRGYVRALNQREEIVRQFETGETAQEMTAKSGWTLLNSVTYPIFNPTSIGKGSDIGQITYTGMMGSRAEKVKKVFRVIEEEVGLPSYEG